jgi:hypothetical protein
MERMQSMNANATSTPLFPPSKLNEILQTEYSPVLSVFCFPYGGVQVAVESVDEPLSSHACTGRDQPFPEPENFSNPMGFNAR